ncbi:hypothetical protein QJS10_CPB12g01637 [Acorus calamus]|uniref:Uncharacterized protein n=1 Tax=Acorus calamus TaxID=4465 RepID=A0AAV9DNT3_ACOCL|nr:hypothetical protein QJS10_CPB12g01637 [Acorus calamus]
MDCGIGVLSDGETSVNNIDNVVTLENVNTSNVVSVDAELSALEVASSYLGPLAARNPDLLKPLKETLLLALLRPDEDSFMKDIPWWVIATSLLQEIAILTPPSISKTNGEV